MENSERRAYQIEQDIRTMTPLPGVPDVANYTESWN
jgi:hypothetical protein